MSNGQTTNRFRLAFILAIFGAVALGSFWLLEGIRKGTEDSMTAKQRSGPDYYVEKFSFVRMSTTGQPKYKVAGKHLAHLALDDSYQIVLPIVQSITNNQAPITAHADKASIEDKRKKITLNGNVIVDRQASKDNEKFHLATDSLVLLPDDEIMKTDLPVFINLGNSTLSGTGMLANNTTQQLQLLSKVHGIFSALSNK